MTNAAPDTVNRLVCYCDDCQAFAHHLDRADLLDANGGSDMVQVAPASLTFTRGTERIVGLRLKPKGLYRWYASCCNTPLGNTVGPSIPFVGIVSRGFDDADAAFGEPVSRILGKHAVGTPPAGSLGLNFRFVARVVRKILGWRLGGRTWPHPFFDRVTRAPSRPLTTLSHEQREALRQHCGPRPAA